MARKATNEESMLSVSIPEIQIKTFTLKLIGDSPLITHAWNEKAKRMMLEKQMKAATSGRTAKDPYEDFFDSLYWLSERPAKTTIEDVAKGRFGFPTTAFKAAAIDAGYQQGILEKKTTARGAFHIIGEFAEIEGDKPEMREDMVRIGQGTADIRYRGEFKHWSVTLHIRYNPMAMSVAQIINLFNVGGFSNGVGEWRPAKDGSYGTFHVAVQGE